MIINNTQPVSKATTDPAFIKLFSDLQGNIIKSHAREHVQLLFIKFVGEQAMVKRWIVQSLVPLITTFEQQLHDTKGYKTQRTFQDPGFCSFSLSAKGYAYLGVDINHKDESFKSGLGTGTIRQDPPKDNWEASYQHDIHAVIILAHDSRTQLGKRILALKTVMAGVANVVAEEAGDALLGEKEHFGFKDGRSQPRFLTEDMAGEGTTINWDPFAQLSLVLTKDPLGKAFNGGFTGQGDEPSDPDNATHSYGSYLVFRKLEQDVAGWNAEVMSNAARMGIKPALFGAYAVGRFQDGTPVVNHDKESGNTVIENDFNYKSLNSEQKCPFHAHIRKANPRGDTGIFQVPLEDEKKIRITRRGIPYGAPEDAQKGLLFMCYQQSIVGQFEFMQNNWIDNPDFLKPGTGTDSTIGQGNVTSKEWPMVHGQPTMFSQTFNHFVSLKGGEYFFTPPVSFLKSL